MSSPLSLSQTAAGALRAEMARQQKTSAELADHLGRSKAYVSQRMNGRHDFTLTEIEHAAAWLGVPYLALLTSPQHESEVAADVTHSGSPLPHRHHRPGGDGEVRS